MARGAIGVQARIQDRSKRVVDAASKGSFRNLSHAAASIRKTAIESMVFAKGPSKPGTPPHAHKGKIRRSVVYSVDKEKQDVIVGPAYSRVTRGGRPPWIAQMLEKGGTFKGKKKGSTRKFPARPFMAPALAEAAKRFAGRWKSSIG